MNSERPNAGHMPNNMAAESPDLSREKIQRLLRAIASGPIEDTTQVECTEYDWRQPHYFSREQLHTLDDFTKRAGKMIANKFASLCSGDFNVTIDSISQHFADELLDRALDNQQDDYYLAFGADQDNQCGLVGIPAQTAFTWATQLLGDTESEMDSGRDLSLLEESLLSDISSAIVHTLANAHSACVFQPARNIVRRLLPLDLHGTEEFCKIAFSVKRDGSDSTPAYLLIVCDHLEPVVGRSTQDTGEFSAKDFSNAVINHLKKMSVSVTAQLASTQLTLKELVSLNPGDVLLLDKDVGRPIELILEGQTLFQGQPAKSADKHAVLITETVA